MARNALSPPSKFIKIVLQRKTDSLLAVNNRTLAINGCLRTDGKQSYHRLRIMCVDAFDSGSGCRAPYV